MKKVMINQQEVVIDDNCSLQALLNAQGINPVGIAVAVNNSVIKRIEWERTMLADGDKVMVIRATCGG